LRLQSSEHGAFRRLSLGHPSPHCRAAGGVNVGSVSIKIPSLWDYNYKKPEGLKYISPRCQPWVGSELAEVPEAQDVHIDECVFASGMKTDDWFFTFIANAQLRPSNLKQGHTII